MGIVIKPTGDIQNGDSLDPIRVDNQLNVLYTLVNGNLDGTNVLPGTVDAATVGGKTWTDILNAPLSNMYRQAIINGNFDVWQRGTSFTNPNNNYTADRFQPSYNMDGGAPPANITHSRLALTPGDIPNAYYGYRVTVDGAGTIGTNGEYAILHKIEFGTRYLAGSGKKITVPIWLRSSIAGKRVGIRFQQRYGSGGTPTAAESINGQVFTLTTNWTKYNITIPTNTLVGKTFGTSNDDSFWVYIGLAWGATIATSYGGSGQETFVGAGTIDIAQLSGNAGDTALPFQPRDPEEELRKSLRFTWVPKNLLQIRQSQNDANSIRYFVPLSVPMRTNPSIRGVAGTDILVANLAVAGQSGFTFAAFETTGGVQIVATKTAHGLTDSYLAIQSTSGFDAEL